MSLRSLSSNLNLVLSDHYVDAEMRLKHQTFESRLQLLDLPTTFDVIVGMDWLTRYDGRVNARARTLEVTTTMGMRIIVAGFGAISSGLPKRGDHRDLNHVAENLCFLHAGHDGNPSGRIFVTRHRCEVSAPSHPHRSY